MNNLRKIYSSLGFIFINLFFLELFAFLVLLFLGTARWNYADSLKSSEIIFSRNSESGQLTHIYHQLFSGGVPHPYFAFRYKGSSYGEKTYYDFVLDVHGFYGDVKFPFEKKSTDFVVGIVGGSVSDQLARYIFNRREDREKLISVLKARYPESKHKEIKLVALGQGGNKQPQQFFIVSYLLKYLDVTINVDGYNEYSNKAPVEYPIEFPSDRGHYSYLNGVDRENHYLHKKIQTILFLREISDMIRLDKHISVLKFSQSYFLFQQFFHTLFAQKILKNLHAIKLEKDNSSKKTTYFAHLYKNRKIPLRVEVWKRFSLQQYYLSKVYGVESLFFLQPIPVIPDAKIWSEEEKEKGYFTNDPKKRKIYKLMRNEIQLLRRKRLPFYDLSYIFKNVGETVYVDKVHLNDKGLEILFKEILKRIKVQN